MCCAALCLPRCGVGVVACCCTLVLPGPVRYPWLLCCAALLGVVLCCCSLGSFLWPCLAPLPAVVCFRALSVALGSCAFWRFVSPCLSALCALRAVCCAVVCWCVLLVAAVLCAVCVLGCRAVPPLSSPRCAVLCCALPVWCAGIVLLGWSVLFLAPWCVTVCFFFFFCSVAPSYPAGACRCRVLCCVLWCSAVLCCAALLRAWCAELLCCVLLRPVLLCRGASFALLCGAVLARLRRAAVLCSVASVVPGGVLWCCLWFLFVCRLALMPVAVSWWRFAASVSLAGLAGALLLVVVSRGAFSRWCPCLAACPAASLRVVVRRGALFPCALSCGAVCLWSDVLWCPAVCFHFLLLPGGVCLFLLPFLSSAKTGKMIFRL